MLKKTKWKNQDPNKVAKSKEFQDWLLKKLKKDVKKFLSKGEISFFAVVLFLVVFLSTPVELAPATTHVESSVVEQITLPQTIQSTVEPIERASEPASDVVITGVNQLRTDRGLYPLVYDYKLTAGANKRAKDMSDAGQWSHDGFQDALREAGLYEGSRPKHHAENLALYQEDGEVVGAWLNSPPHAELMLLPMYSKIGVGRYEGYTVLWMGD